jgi:hypothetical protein
MDSPDDEWVFFSWYKAGVRSLAARLESKGVSSASPWTATCRTRHGPT